jgi:hypothetical protein
MALLTTGGRRGGLASSLLNGGDTVAPLEAALFLKGSLASRNHWRQSLLAMPNVPSVAEFQEASKRTQ